VAEHICTLPPRACALPIAVSSCSAPRPGLPPSSPSCTPGAVNRRTAALCGGATTRRPGGVTTSRGRSSSAWTIIVAYRSHLCGRCGTRMGGGHGQDTRAGTLRLYVGVGRNQPSRHEKVVPLLGRRLRRWSETREKASVKAPTARAAAGVKTTRSLVYHSLFSELTARHSSEHESSKQSPPPLPPGVTRDLQPQQCCANDRSAHRQLSTADVWSNRTPRVLVRGTSQRHPPSLQYVKL
jgi:hypothetical protein